MNLQWKPSFNDSDAFGFTGGFWQLIGDLRGDAGIPEDIGSNYNIEKWITDHPEYKKAFPEGSEPFQYVTDHEYSCLYYYFRTEEDACYFSRVVQTIQGIPLDEDGKKHPTDLKQVSALAKEVIGSGVFYNILDFGGGVSDKAADMAAGKGISLYPVDPALHNHVNSARYQKFLSAAAMSPRLSTVICANVLNVILDDEAYVNAVNGILAIGRYLQLRQMFISVYEGDRSGVFSATQRNQTVQWHLGLVSDIAKSYNYSAAKIGKNTIVLALDTNPPKLPWA